MAKLTILLALVAALLFAAHASARRSQQEGRCDRQLERANLGPCEDHIMQRIQRDEDENGDVLYIRRGTDLHRRCCNELLELEENPRCMCQALQQILENQSDRLQTKSQVQQFERELRNLPQSCGLRSPSDCDFSGRD